MKRLIITILTLLLLIAIAGAFIQGIITTAEEHSIQERFGNIDYAQYGIDTENWNALMDNAVHDERLISILEHIQVYSNDMIKLAIVNPDARDYAANYWQHTDEQIDPSSIELTCSDSGVPLLFQWDSRWGYNLYGGKPMGLTGCGPTSLSMVSIALTGNTALNPLYLARFSEEHDFYVNGVGTSWDLMRSGAAALGLNWQEVGLNQEDMYAALDQGAYLICSMLPGDFTTSGHFIVIDGYDSTGFTVKDPNSAERSRSWSYDRLAGQIAVIWAYSI